MERNRVFEPLDDYTQNTHNVAAQKRARDLVLAVPAKLSSSWSLSTRNLRASASPLPTRQSRCSIGRPSETRIRAVESISSLLGWDRNDTRCAPLPPRHRCVKLNEGEGVWKRKKPQNWRKGGRHGEESLRQQYTILFTDLASLTKLYMLVGGTKPVMELNESDRRSIAPTTGTLVPFLLSYSRSLFA